VINSVPVPLDLELRIFPCTPNIPWMVRGDKAEVPEVVKAVAFPPNNMVEALPRMAGLLEPAVIVAQSVYEVPFPGKVPPVQLVLVLQSFDVLPVQV
jgi:hypothetical protein